MDKCCANYQNNARNAYQGDRTQRVVQSLQFFPLYIGVPNMLFVFNFTADLVKEDVVPEDFIDHIFGDYRKILLLRETTKGKMIFTTLLRES